ncbi:MAG TPA: M23 family metallopeptidase [Candidatus Polarisedimenticolia bacterium]|nr:M23 family metallopeptidase [Candidatus Polarisedimenticolia bacterium]
MLAFPALSGGKRREPQVLHHHDRTHATARFRRLRISKNLVIITAVFVGALLLCGVLLPHFVIRSTYLSWVTSRLAKQNAELRRANEEIDATLNDVRARMNEFETRTAQLGMMIGINSLPISRQAAAGGGLDLKTLPPAEGARFVKGELEVLRERTGALQDSFKILDVAFAKQALLLSSTPSIMPVKGLFGNGYGWRKAPFTGMRDFHQGLDIVAPPGTRVLAPADGIVTQVGPSGGFGNSIVLAHGYGIITRYAHLGSFNVRTGQRVHRNDVLGFVGSTGRSTGPHLHYEVLVHQRNVDPLRYILEEFRSF